MGGTPNRKITGCPTRSRAKMRQSGAFCSKGGFGEQSKGGNFFPRRTMTKLNSGSGPRQPADVFIINSRSQVRVCYSEAGSAPERKAFRRTVHGWRSHVPEQDGFRRGCAPVGTTSTLPSVVARRGHRVPAWPAHESPESSVAAAAGSAMGRRRLLPPPTAFSAELPAAGRSLTWKFQLLASKEAREAVEDEQL